MSSSPDAAPRHTYHVQAAWDEDAGVSGMWVAQVISCSPKANPAPVGKSTLGFDTEYTRYMVHDLIATTIRCDPDEFDIDLEFL